MAPDPIIYCLEQLTDYEQFERLCHDIAALDGYRNIEPLGGSKDRGRDALHVHNSDGTTTVFAYSVREDWKKKLSEDCSKVHRNGHICSRLAFFCTSAFTATQRDNAVKVVERDFGWSLDLYGLERLAVLLRTTHNRVLAQHPQLFCPPFFPVAGGLSLSPAFDHVILDHADSDTALAHFLARRLTLAGYRTWCRGLAPVAGSSIADTVRGLLENRAFRYICVLSRQSLSDPQLAMRRGVAQHVGKQRGTSMVIPALADSVDESLLDPEFRAIEPARFDNGWAVGLKQLEGVLRSHNCPREPEGACQLALRSYFPDELVLAEPEALVSNVFPVIRMPEVIHRFCSRMPLSNTSSPWSFKQVDEKTYLSFHRPPGDLSREFGITPNGGAVWLTTNKIDGVPVEHLLIELTKKAMHAECQRRGLKKCEQTELVYFPEGLLKNDNLRFKTLDGTSTFFTVTGERRWGRDGANPYRYHIAPEFRILHESTESWEITLRIRIRITNADGTIPSGHGVNARRKKLCKSWWNKQWLHRILGVAQFLANGSDRIEVGEEARNQLIVAATPRTWGVPIRLNEDALTDDPDADDLVLPIAPDDDDGDNVGDERNG